MVQSVTCRTEGIPFGAIELTQIPPALRDTETNPLVLQPEDGLLVISDLDLTARRAKFDCFSSEDLEISANGDLAIQSTKPLTVSVVENPPRIILSQAE